MLDHHDSLLDAMRDDFGRRSSLETLHVEIALTLAALRYARRHVRRWMRPERRKVVFPMSFFGARARVLYQPLGVVGVVSPWNSPINLTFSPLAGVLAAGNRCLLKLSEFTPRTSERMAELFEQAFEPTEVAVVLGGAQTGADFCSLPLDHLLFTGATSVAKHVMRAAAENLVPVTLELGGKSPVIIGRSANLARAARCCMWGKTLNAGQICLAPDYMFVPSDLVDSFVHHMQTTAAEMFPTLLDSEHYTSVINERHYERLRGYVDDARQHGARIVELNAAGEDFEQQEHFILPLTLILNPRDDMQVMQDEIFGPLLPIRTYTDVNEVIQFVNARPRPLALYYFGSDKSERRLVLSRTISGGATVNDVMWHWAQEDLPFGGVGHSGLGRYHAMEGFKTFSHAKSVYFQSRFEVPRLLGLYPPFKKIFDRWIRFQIRK